MLKKSLFSPAQPRRAEARHFPYIVLGSSKSSTYPAWEKSCYDSSGLGGWKCYAFGFESPAALLKNFLSTLHGGVLLSQTFETLDFLEPTPLFLILPATACQRLPWRKKLHTDLPLGEERDIIRSIIEVSANSRT